VNARNALSALFGLRAVPIVNENDATATDEIRAGASPQCAGC
jgi:glutamate 5-kinase